MLLQCNICYYNVIYVTTMYNKRIKYKEISFYKWSIPRNLSCNHVVKCTNLFPDNHPSTVYLIQADIWHE